MTSSPSAVVARVPARVHLAGNPSDGYGGAVLSAPFAALAAEVRIEPADSFSVGGPVQCWVTLDALADDAARHGHDGGDRLVTAALVALHRVLPPTLDRRPGRISWSTTIPRSVGLGGSSAIVLATMRAALDWWDTSLVETGLDRLELARAALAAEIDGLGIPGGIADRTVQAWTEIVRTDGRTDPPTVEIVAPARPVELVVAWNERAAAPSDRYHRSLRARFDAGEAEVTEAVAGLADLADAAADGLKRGDPEAFTAALDASLVIRRRLGPVPAAAVEPVDHLRAAGGRVNFAGSGGSLVIAGDVRVPDGWTALPLVLSPTPGSSPSSR